ncbi:MAG: SDR family NAD(P)-dependent oxidoreductase, partial [Gammaproteobacteria bacterium]
YTPVWRRYELAQIEREREETGEILTYDARIAIHKTLQSAEALLLFLQQQIQENKPPLRLNIITEQAYSIHGENINLDQAILNGLIKTAILEHPELNIRQVDVTMHQAIEPLFNALKLDTGSEQILAYREDIWYMEKVVPEVLANRENQRLTLPEQEYRLIKNVNGVIEGLTLIEEKELKILNPDEVMIEPRAVGLNFRDVLNAMNLYPGEPGPLGGDVAGIVKAVGNNITRYHAGDEVLGFALGSLSSQVTTRSELIIHKPARLSFTEAAAIPTVFLTAYLALVKLGKLQAGETVLIHAATGGVGLAAVQIAQYLKAKIIATVGSDEKRDYLHGLGIEQVFNSRSLSYQMDIQRVTDDLGVDVVLNSLTGPGFVEATLNCCAKHARFIEIAKRDIWSVEEVKAKRPDIIYHILALDTLSADEPQTIQQLLQEVMLLFEDKKIRSIPQTIFPLTQAIAAFKYLQQAKQIGKVVITLPPVSIQFKEQASYLITGGLGGLGLEVAKYMGAHGAKRVILTSRSAPGEKARDTIKVLENQGVEIIIKQIDVSNKKAVEDLIKYTHNRIYPLKGIFHLAGTIADAPIDKQTAESFAQVFAPKALGAKYLHEITQKKNIKLDYFVLFSSMASLNGSPAQSNYATANSFLDALAELRYQEGLNALSINWGPWREVGMAADLVAMHERQGMKPLKLNEALAALTYILKQDPVQVGVIHADWKRVSERMTQVPTWLKDLVEQKGESAFIQQLQVLTQAQRETLLKEAITQEVRKVLGLSSQQPIDENKGFFDMGMDSLMALELKNRLQGLIDQPLPNTWIFDYSNISANYIALTKLLGLEEIEKSPLMQKMDKLNDKEIMQAIDKLFNKKINKQ